MRKRDRTSDSRNQSLCRSLMASLMAGCDQLNLVYVSCTSMWHIADAFCFGQTTGWPWHVCRSFVCGCLKHSPTVCIYILPPEGPSKADLLIMSVLSKRVAMLPVVTGATILAQGEQRSCQQMVSDVLLRPGRYVPGLQHIDVVK